MSSRADMRVRADRIVAEWKAKRGSFQELRDEVALSLWDVHDKGYQDGLEGAEEDE